MSGAVVIAFSSILVDLSGASPATAAIFRCVYALPVLLVLARQEERGRSEGGSRHCWRLYVAGALLGLDLILWHHAIRDVGAGMATMLANIQVILLPLVAWVVWRERPSARVLVALPFAGLGVVLISGVFGDAEGVNPIRGAVLGLLACFAYVGFLLLMRGDPRARRRVAGGLLDATVAAAAFCLIAGLLTGEAELVPTWPSVGWLVVLALSSQVFGWLLITASMPSLPAATTSLILIAQPACTVVFAAIILDQIPSLLQILGVVLVLGCLAAVVGRSPPRAPAPVDQ